MRNNARQLMLVTLLPVITLAFAGYANGQTAGKGQDEAAIEAAALRVTATVVAVDASKRTVSLVGPLGRTNTYTLGKQVINFDQIKAGDQVKATVLESVAVFVGKAGAPASVGEGSMVALAPKGAMPGVVMAKTAEITDKIDSVDAKNRTISIEGVSGQPRTFKVGPKVNLAELKKGDDVVLRVTEALAILVEKPQGASGPQ